MSHFILNNNFRVSNEVKEKDLPFKKRKSYTNNININVNFIEDEPNFDSDEELDRLLDVEIEKYIKDELNNESLEESKDNIEDNRIEENKNQYKYKYINNELKAYENKEDFENTYTYLEQKDILSNKYIYDESFNEYYNKQY